MAVSCREENGIMVMTFSGCVSKQEALSAREEASLRQMKDGVRAYLVDIRNAQIPISTTDLYDFFASLNAAFDFRTRHAVLYSPEKNDLADIAFGENMSVNRGIFLRVFSQKAEALAWLNNENSS